MDGEGGVEASSNDGSFRRSDANMADGVDTTKFGCTESIFNHDFIGVSCPYRMFYLFDESFSTDD